MKRTRPARREHRDTAAFIAAHLPVAAVPDLPEIRLHRAAPASGLNRLAAADPDFGPPYWAHLWGGGLALARFVRDRPERVAGRRVLDLGTGSGLVAIAAMKAGAAAATAADVDPYALAAAGLNATLNGVTLSFHLGDLTAGPPPADTELILVGDLFYEAKLAARVAAFLDRCAAAGIAVLIGDPWRAPLPRARLRRLADYEVSETANAPKPAAVFALD